MPEADPGRTPAELRELVLEAQAAVHATPHRPHRRGRGIVLGAAAHLTLSATGAGAVPFWTPLALLALAVAKIGIDMRAGRSRPHERKVGMGRTFSRVPPDGRYGGGEWLILGGIALSLPVGALTGLWWSGLAVMVATMSTVRAILRPRARAAWADPTRRWPRADPSLHPSELLGDPTTLQLVAAFAVLSEARPPAIAAALGREPDAFDDAVTALRKHGYLALELHDGVGTLFHLTRLGRRTFREHLTTLAPPPAPSGPGTE